MSASSKAKALFKVSPATGEITLRSELEGTIDASFELTVAATDNGKPSKKRSECVVHVFVVRFGAPVFSNQTQSSVPVTEHSPKNTLVVQLGAKAQHNQTNQGLKYAIQAGNDDGMFGIDSNTGRVFVSGEIDREIQKGYQLTFRVTDYGPLTKSTDTGMEITITDINDNGPTFLDLPYFTTIAESTTVGNGIFPVKTRDIDAGQNRKIVYNISSGNEENAFYIDVGGELRLAKPLVLTTVDVFNIEVTARDLGQPPNYAKTTIVVTIQRFDPPLFVAAAYQGSVDENSAAGARTQVTVSAQAQHTDSNMLVQYSIVEIHAFANQTDQKGQAISTADGYFVMSTVNTGEVLTAKTLDREKYTHYKLVVKGQDHALVPKSSKVTVDVAVNDENDEDPAFEQSRYTVAVLEEHTVSTAVIQVFAYDLDAGENGAVEYSMKETGPGKTNPIFEINQDGRISLRRELETTSGQEFVLIVTAEDKGSPMRRNGSCEVFVRVTRFGPPLIASLPTHVAVVEHAVRDTTVLQFAAVALHNLTNQNLKFTIRSGNEAGMFGVEEASGRVYVVGDIDRETAGNYTLTFRATDYGALQKWTDVTTDITVTDINDGDPFFDALTYAVSILEEKVAGDYVYTVSAKDTDSGPRATIAYSIGPLNAAGLSEETKCGECIARLGQTSGCIRASDVTTVSPSTTEVFGPVTHSSNSTNAANISAATTTRPAGDPATTVPGTHIVPAGCDHCLDELTQHCAGTTGSGSDSGSGPWFAIDRDTGAIRIIADARQILNDSITLSIEATDSGKSPRIGHSTVVVTIIRYDPPLFESKPPSQLTVAENAAFRTKISKIDVAIQHEYPNRGLTFAIDKVIAVKAPRHLEMAQSRWVRCAGQDEVCTCTGFVRFGLSTTNQTAWFSQRHLQSSAINCTTAQFGDPAPTSAIDHRNKRCECFAEPSQARAVQTLEVANWPFRLGKDSGVLSLGEVELDREMYNQYVVTVSATDHSPLAKVSTHKFNIDVEDYNDVTPEFVTITQAVHVREDHAVGRVLASFAAYDPDALAGNVSFTLVATPPQVTPTQHCASLMASNGSSYAKATANNGHGSLPFVVDASGRITVSQGLDGLATFPVNGYSVPGSLFHFAVVVTDPISDSGGQRTACMPVRVVVSLVPDMLERVFVLHATNNNEKAVGTALQHQSRDPDAQYCIVGADTQYGTWMVETKRNGTSVQVPLPANVSESNAHVVQGTQKVSFVLHQSMQHFTGIAGLKIRAFNRKAFTSQQLNTLTDFKDLSATSSVAYVVVKPAVPTPTCDSDLCSEAHKLDPILQDIQSVANGGSSVAELLVNTVQFTPYPILPNVNSNPENILGCDKNSSTFNCTVDYFAKNFPREFQSLMPGYDRAVEWVVGTLRGDIGEWQWASTKTSKWVPISAVKPARLLAATGTHTWNARKELWEAPAPEEASGHLRFVPASTAVTGRATLSVYAWQGRFADFADGQAGRTPTVLTISVEVLQVPTSPTLETPKPDATTGAIMIDVAGVSYAEMHLGSGERVGDFVTAGKRNALKHRRGVGTGVVGMAVTGLYSCEHYVAYVPTPPAPNPNVTYVAPHIWDCKGEWQYSTQSNPSYADWISFPPKITTYTAVLLGPEYRLRYVPHPNSYWNNTLAPHVRLVFRAWDMTEGKAGQRRADAQYVTAGAYSVKFAELSVTRSPHPKAPATYDTWLPFTANNTRLSCSNIPDQQPIADRAMVDSCGVCNGNGIDQDCDGHCFGSASIDDCGVCTGGTTGYTHNQAKDCAGKCAGLAVIDSCGVCSRGTTGVPADSVLDCAGVCNGKAKVGQSSCGSICHDGTVKLAEDCAGVCLGSSIEDGCGDCKSQALRGLLQQEFNAMACVAGAASGAVATPTQSSTYGGARIVIEDTQGLGFVDNSWIYMPNHLCRFTHRITKQEFTSKATILSRNQLTCFAPAVPLAGQFDLFMSLGGTKFNLVTNKFNYYADPFATNASISIDPSKIQVQFDKIDKPALYELAGGSRNIMIEGTNFQRIGDAGMSIKCLLLSPATAEAKAQGFLYQSQITEGSVLDKTRIQCGVSEMLLSQNVQIHLSLDATSYITTGLAYTVYQAPPVLKSVSLLQSGAGISVRFDSTIALSSTSDCAGLWNTASQKTLGIEAAGAVKLCTISADALGFTMHMKDGVKVCKLLRGVYMCTCDLVALLLE